MAAGASGVHSVDISKFWSPQIPVPIVFVEDEETFEKVAKALKHAAVVGLDAEWRPRFLATRKQAAASVPENRVTRTTEAPSSIQLGDDVATKEAVSARLREVPTAVDSAETVRNGELPRLSLR